MTENEYWELYEYQDGHCALCPANGKTKHLSVDHDHQCCPEPPTCGKCTRGLLCGPCNQMVIGRLGLEGLRRGVRYLNDPPMKGYRKWYGNPS